MKNPLMTDQRKQSGVAAIEFAFILPVMVSLLALTLFLGRICWHYTVAHKAAHDAGLMLANATKLEIGISKVDLSDVEVANLAKAVVAEEIAELNPGLGGRPRVEVYCDNLACIGGGTPKEIKVVIRMRMFDSFLDAFTEPVFGTDGLWLIAEVRAPYVGS